MAEARLQDVAPGGGVGAGAFLGDQGVCFLRRHVEIDDAGFAWELVERVLEMLDPGDEGVTLFARGAGGLMRQVGADIAVGENHEASSEGSFDLRLCFEAVSGIEHRREVRINGFERAEFAVQKLRDHASEPGIVLREGDAKYGMAAGGEGFFEQLHLSALAAAVDAFHGDE